MQDPENQSLSSRDSNRSSPPESRSLRPSSLFFNDRGLRAGWRFVLFLVLLRLVLIPLVFGVIRPLRHRLQSSVGDISDALLLACTLLATLIMSKLERRTLLSYGLKDAVALPHLFSGTLTGFASLSLMLLGLRATHHLTFGPRSMGGSQLLVVALLNLLGFLIVALFEENAFRGYALHTLAEGIGFWPAALMMSILFALVHVQNPGESSARINRFLGGALDARAMEWAVDPNLWRQRARQLEGRAAG